MNAELAKAYAALRKHEVRCVVCSNPGYAYLCPARAALRAKMIAVRLPTGKAK